MATIKGIAIPALKQLAYKLAEQTGKNVEQWVKALINSQSLLISQPTQDSIWISELNGTRFWHPRVPKLTPKMSSWQLGERSLVARKPKMTS